MVDTLSHAAWGWATLRWRGPRSAWLGALAGAAPDLLYFVPAKIQSWILDGPRQLFVEQDPHIWRAFGPPLPAPVQRAYDTFYVWTHSGVVLLAACIALAALGARRWLWLALPYALHLGLDVLTHERHEPRLLHPLSSWIFRGLAWGDPRVFVPHLALLVVTLVAVREQHGRRVQIRPLP
jgi:hypothetical protein